MAEDELFWKIQRQSVFLIIGLGVTGKAVVSLFSQKKIDFYILNREKASAKDRTFLKKLGVPLKKFLIDDGKNEEVKALFSIVDKIMLSPGVPRTTPLVKKAQEKNIPILSEFDFFFPLIKKKKIIAITGTNGKTTITKLCDEILKTKHQVFCGGNIGRPLSEAINDINRYEIILVELSSYMLEEIKQFRPNIAVISNLSEDHLDRYRHFTHYIQTKFNLLKWMKLNDVFIKNIDDNHIRKKKTKKLTTIAVSIENNDSYHVKNHFIYKKSRKYLDLAKINLTSHPINILIAITIGEINNIPAKNIKQALVSFKPLEHRLEMIAHERYLIYNDSKATTLESVINAIEILFAKHLKKMRLIIGGKGKNFSFSKLKHYGEKIEKLYFYGDEGLKIKRELNQTNSVFLKSFREIVANAYQEMTNDEILLLSPGCASFDQFDNYQARGDCFKQMIKNF